ncbi:hypothetical protein LINPERHAP1_LOCUS36229, partial [Linum perenne]
MATSSKLALFFMVSLLFLGEMSATIRVEQMYPPTGQTCKVVGDCKGGVYCVC